MDLVEPAILDPSHFAGVSDLSITRAAEQARQILEIQFPHQFRSVIDCGPDRQASRNEFSIGGLGLGPGPGRGGKLIAKIAEDCPLASPACGGDIRLIAFVTDSGADQADPHTSRSVTRAAAARTGMRLIAAGLHAVVDVTRMAVLASEIGSGS